MSSSRPRCSGLLLLLTVRGPNVGDSVEAEVMFMVVRFAVLRETVMQTIVEEY
jgi:hypothetical protein